MSHSELKAAGERLEQLQLSSDQAHENLQTLLENHTHLLQEHALLLQAHTKLVGECKKHNAANVPPGDCPEQKMVNNSFAVVLIDGDGYMFKPELIKSNQGHEAATRLKCSVKGLLQPRELPVPDNCRLIIRIYANIPGLIKKLAGQNVSFPYERSVQLFTRQFNQFDPLFDFIDVGPKELATYQKMTESLIFFSSNVQCVRILFAGCNNPKYIPLLFKCGGHSRRIALIRNGMHEQKFSRLGFRSAQFPGIFDQSKTSTKRLMTISRQAVTKMGISKSHNMLQSVNQNDQSSSTGIIQSVSQESYSLASEQNPLNDSEIDAHCESSSPSRSTPAATTAISNDNTLRFAEEDLINFSD